ncbi:hypothetical protein ACN9MN_04920 [Chryseobacterium sp. S-02]|jgi:hypothetical protein|uniref:hypothetical protein n=1 Tax=unclassified Chryseobacterium TaxID=2593645 RepID=UPI0028600828|nr:hypothetical protein [Chryseobacterium sp. 2987]MDF2931127.1 hypothetical protein [Chryseobacterium sp.]MDR6919923.1 hypothetical protein [Chryseobacterium sp. 2987]
MDGGDGRKRKPIQQHGHQLGRFRFYKVAQAATVNKNTDELIESIKKKNADAKFTKNITKDEIGKTSFYKTFIKVDLGNNVSQNYIIYNAIINGYNASFCIIYLNETPELIELLNAFKDSKFKIQ